MAKISIVIVTWNSQRVLGDCIASLYAHVPVDDMQVLIVDNDSRDKEYLQTIARNPNLTVIQNNANLGYAKAVNRGFHQATGDYFLVMNPDMVYTTNPFPSLIAEMEKDQEIGVIGPLLHDGDGNPQILDFYPTLPTVSQYIVHHTDLRRFSFFKRLGLKHFHANPKIHGVNFVEQIPGAFLLMRRDIFQGEAPMNEAYFIWYEDVDFCKRILLSGKKVALLTTERVTHFGGTSFVMRELTWRRLMTTQSFLTYVELYFGPVAYLAQLFCMVLNGLVIILPIPVSLVLKGPKKVKARVILETKVLRMILLRLVFRIFHPNSPPPNQGQFPGY